MRTDPLSEGRVIHKVIQKGITGVWVLSALSHTRSSSRLASSLDGVARTVAVRIVQDVVPDIAPALNHSIDQPNPARVQVACVY